MLCLQPVSYTHLDVYKRQIGNGNAKTGETAPIAAVAVVIGLAAVSLLGAKKRK